MNRWLKRAGTGVLAASAAVAAWAGYVEVTGIPRYAPPAIPDLHVEATPERLARGTRLANMLCADCHEDPTTHRLTGKPITDLPPELGTVYSANITKDLHKGIGARTDGEIAVLLRTGLRRDGSFVPPWMPRMAKLSDEDVASIITFLRSDDPRVAATPVDPPGRTTPGFLGKVLTHTVIKPLPYPSAPIVAPPEADKVAYGRYLVFALDCYSCHSADIKTTNPLEPEQSKGYMGGGSELVSVTGGTIRSANLTPDATAGIGTWSEDDFVRALRRGFRPDGRALRYPMTPRVHMTDDEARAIYAYLRTVPAIPNVVARDFAAPPADADPGRRAYVAYGCSACHGDTGVGRNGKADLTKANEHFATDAELRAWIDEAPKKKPGTEMPGYQGIIRGDDYAPLMAHVRTLARRTAMADHP